MAVCDAYYAPRPPPAASNCLPLRPAPAVIFTEVIKLLICLVMQFKAIAGEVAGGTAGKPSPPPGSSSSLGAMHSSSSSAASLFGGAGQPGSRGALVREVRRQARDIAAKSLPMLLPAGMFVMQQVRRAEGMGCQPGTGPSSSSAWLPGCVDAQSCCMWFTSGDASMHAAA